LPSKSWGTEYSLDNYEIVEETAEIPEGQMCYVVSSSVNEYDEVGWGEWQTLQSGNMYYVKQAIEAGVPNCTLRFIRVSWDRSQAVDVAPHITVMRVWGFKIEALVENTGGAGLTGLEIVVIIAAIAFLSTVVAFIAMGGYTVYKVVEATEKVNPLLTVVVGLIIFGVVVAALLLMLGVKGKAKGKRGAVQVGK